MKYLHNVTTIEVYPERCTACGLCIAVCPHNVLRIENKRIQIVDRDACMECGACQRNCAWDAISVNAGVGCAAAVINGALSGSAPSCGCGSEESGGCCGN